MKKIFTMLCVLAAGASLSAQDGTGIYLSGDMNEWSINDPAWEFKTEAEIPGWASIDLSELPAGTNFRIVGLGRDFGMKNDRNTIRTNSLHLMTHEGKNKLVACDEGLGGVHLMVQTEGFTTDKYIGIITRTADTQTLYGACMETSVTPALLTTDASDPMTVSGNVEITEPWFVVQAYQLSNATQTVCNYGLSDTDGVLTPTSNLAPTALAIPVPADGAGEYKVTFNTQTYSYHLGDDSGVQTIALSGSSDSEAYYYNLQGIRVAEPVKGNLYIKVSGGKADKVIAD